MNLVLRVLLVSLVLAVPAFAVDGVPTFRAGLQAFQANGTDALLNAWYDGDEEREKVAELKRRLQAMTRDLGPVIDTEVFAPRNLGRHVQRLYGVIYFRKRPLWLRAEYYSIQGRAGFISLEFSPLADDILPLEIGTASR
ncbi:MAG: hypothetical protein JNJ82_24380 [Opitutaceae bacterium]|nr:hypothetical protein [Opitutaceae bacterium]